MLTGGEIDLLDFDTERLGEFFRRSAALGRFLDITNSLVGPVDPHYECRHVVLQGLRTALVCRARQANVLHVEVEGAPHKAGAAFRLRCLPTA